MVLLGAAMFLGLCWAIGQGIDQAVNAIGRSYRDHKAAWVKAHPNASKAARWAPLAATIIHAPRHGGRAFVKDWREHYGSKRDEIRAKYAPDPPAAPQRKPGPRPAAAKRPADPQPDTSPPAHLTPAPAPVRPVLRLIPTVQEGTPSTMSIATQEITGTAGLRAHLEDSVRYAQALADDAADGVQRAQDYLDRVSYASEVAPSILDNDPQTAGTIGGLVEPAQQRLDAEHARANAADHQLAQAQQALAELEAHRATEEAVQSNANVSSDTSVYQDS